MKIVIGCDHGALALKGCVNDAVLERLLDNPFFGRPLPKSLDRLSFHKGMAYLSGLSAADGAATLNHRNTESRQ